MTAGSLLGAICLAGLSRISQPWQLYLLWAGGLGLAMALTLYNVSFTVVANFFHRRRGAALALLTLIGGLASPIYIPLAGWLVDRLGWREALVVLAATVVLVALPIHALVIRRRPEDIGLAPDGASTAAEPHGAYLREALAGRVFWLLTLAALATALAYGLVLEHGVAMLIARGYSDVAAASLIGLTGVASLPGRLVFNLLSDRLGPQGLLALCTAAQGAGVLLLLASPAPFVFGFVAVYGLAFGAISPLRASVMAEHFGRVAYGSITGVQNLVTAVSSAAGALLGGYLFDAFGNYELAIAVTGASFLVGGLFVSMTPQPA
jgi:MFS family permease